MVSLTGHRLLHHKREVGNESVRQSPAGSARIRLESGGRGNYLNFPPSSLRMSTSPHIPGMSPVFLLCVGRTGIEPSSPTDQGRCIVCWVQSHYRRWSTLLLGVQ